MIISILRPSCLIHLQIRAEWVPAARSWAITDVETCRNFYVNLLVTDVILLIIMLAGLLRLRRGGGGSFYLFAPPLETGGALLVLVRRDAVISPHLTFLRVLFGSQLPPPQNSRKR